MTVRNILVATDFGASAAAALDYGASLARSLDATLHVVHVTRVRHRDLSRELVRLRAAVDLLAEVTTRAVVVRARTPAKALLEYARAKHIDLIVVGTDGRDGSGALRDYFRLGTVKNLVRNAPCAVLTTRGPFGAAA